MPGGGAMNARLARAATWQDAPGAGGRWAAIWQSGLAYRVPNPDTDSVPRAEMTLCLEFTLPSKPLSGPIRLWQGAAAVDRALGLYAMPDGAFRLVHGEIDLITPPDLGRAGETLSLRYRACAKGRGDIADFVNHDRAQRYRLRAGLAHATRLDEMMPRDAGFLRSCHVAAIAEFGLAPTDMPGLGAGAMVATPRGPVAVETLRDGDEVVTVTGEVLPLRWVERRARLCLGRQAPVVLRAPYFGLLHDICVTPDTRVMRSGPAVDYIFGEERVLVRADDMISSPGAARDRRRPVRAFHHLMLDDHACVSIDRCGVETALLADVVAAEDAGPAVCLAERDRTPCLPVLDRAGAQALVAASVKGRRSLT
jgi:hypothetical protein